MATLTPNYFVALTDVDWLRFLRAKAPLDEVNFWRPSGQIWHLPFGTPFIFKTRAPRHQIVGGGYVGIAKRMVLREAWEFFGEKNGAGSIGSLISAIEAHSRGEFVTAEKPVGCMVLQDPFFFADDDAFVVPDSWRKNSPGFKANASDPTAAAVWERIVGLLSAYPQPALSILQPFGGIGAERVYRPRLGQGTFRSLILDAYGNQCAVTQEHSLPVLEAAHIVDFADEQQHALDNGIALRADIHKLFDRGYVSVRPDLTFAVSKSLRDEFNNGRIYYDLDGRRIVTPSDPALMPRAEYLERHYAEKFKH